MSILLAAAGVYPTMSQSDTSGAVLQVIVVRLCSKLLRAEVKAPSELNAFLQADVEELLHIDLAHTPPRASSPTAQLGGAPRTQGNGDWDDHASHSPPCSSARGSGFRSASGLSAARDRDRFCATRTGLTQAGTPHDLADLE